MGCCYDDAFAWTALWWKHCNYSNIVTIWKRFFFYKKKKGKTIGRVGEKSEKIVMNKEKTEEMKIQLKKNEEEIGKIKNG